ncbi:hypothetical protein [Paenibacillus kandeliae]|uniref:hypothetical protein n=1 Tax=Paenibacillus kandeliae TaxID=3231269 RepID=UPI0034587F1D
MNQFHCMNHPDRDALHQCSQCGKPLCEECYDSTTGGCRNNDHAAVHPAPFRPPMPQHSLPSASSGSRVFWQIVVALLAVLGGIALLLLAICGAMIFSY